MVAVKTRELDGVPGSMELSIDDLLSDEEAELVQHSLELISPFVFSLVKCVLNRARLPDANQDDLDQQVLEALAAEYRAYASCAEAKIYLDATSSET